MKSLLPHKFILLLILLSILFLSACDVSTSKGGGPEKVLGTRGLVLNFLDSSLMDTIYEGDLYYLQVKLFNEGGYDITDGVLQVSIDDKAFDILNKESFESFDLRGDDGLFEGEQKISEIQLKSKPVNLQGITAFDSTITVNACYEYKTHFQDTFCVDTDIKGTQAQKPCTEKSLSGSKGQGAPVVVSKVIPRVTMGEQGARVSFDIYIENHGDGTVLSSGSSSNVCLGQFRDSDFSLITLSDVQLSKYSLADGTITCGSHTSSPNEFDLDNVNKKFIRCSLVNEVPYSEGTFSTPMIIDLSYGYLQTIKTSVLIEKP